MIQRIQTLFLVVILFLTPIFFYFIGSYQTDQILFGMFSIILIGILTIITIFAYSKRNLQIKLNYINSIINVLLIGFFGYSLLNSSGGISFPEKGVELFVPLVNIILLLLANRFIAKDEKLVKSVDRLR